jgi:hypothetical protein
VAPAIFFIDFVELNPDFLHYSQLTVDKLEDPRYIYINSRQGASQRRNQPR